jgi:DNA-binding transcriptional MerR regulator
VDDVLHIGEAAALVGITTKALRHYEKIGLLNPAREDNGYRLYRPADILRLERIRQLQSLGLSLRRIKRILDEIENEDLWLLVLEGLLDEIDEEIDELEARRQRVIDLLDGELPDPLSVGEVVPVSPRVQEFLDTHLAPEMWLREQMMYAHLQSLFAPAVHALPFAYPQPEFVDMPVGRVEWFGGLGGSFR